MLLTSIFLLSLSNIIIPQNNSIYFPGNTLNLEWNNINDSQYVNIQMYINKNDTWKTYIENHHLFSVTTDSNNCCKNNDYKIFLPYYFSSLWDKKFKINIKNIGIENPKINSIHFTMFGINVDAYNYHLTWESNYLNTYESYFYDSETTIYNYDSKIPIKYIGYWNNTNNGMAYWNGNNLNGKYKILIISNDKKIVGISDSILYTTTSTTTTSSSSTTTSATTSTTTSATTSTTTSTTTTTTTSATTSTTTTTTTSATTSTTTSATTSTTTETSTETSTTIETSTTTETRTTTETNTKSSIIEYNSTISQDNKEKMSSTSTTTPTTTASTTSLSSTPTTFTSYRTNTSSFNYTTNKSSITPTIFGLIDDKNKTIYKEGKKKHNDWFILIIFSSSLLLCFCLLILFLFLKKKKDKKIYPKPTTTLIGVGNYSNTEQQHTEPNQYDVLNRSQYPQISNRLCNNGLYGFGVERVAVHNNPVYESNSDVENC